MLNVKCVEKGRPYTMLKVCCDTLIMVSLSFNFCLLLVRPAFIIILSQNTDFRYGRFVVVVVVVVVVIVVVVVVVLGSS